MAYTTCTVGLVSRGDDGGVQTINLVFTGNAGETPRTFQYAPGTGTKAEELLRAQQYRDSKLVELNNKKALADLDGLVDGLVIGAAPVAGGPSADELAATAWVRKVDQLAHFSASGVVPSGQFATAVTNLKDAVNSEYNAANGALRTLMAGKL